MDKRKYRVRKRMGLWCAARPHQNLPFSMNFTQAGIYRAIQADLRTHYVPPLPYLGSLVK